MVWLSVLAPLPLDPKKSPDRVAVPAIITLASVSASPDVASATAILSSIIRTISEACMAERAAGSVRRSWAEQPSQAWG